MQGLDESSLGSQHIFNENKDLCFTIRFQATNRPRPPMEDIEIYYISKCMHFIALNGSNYVIASANLRNRRKYSSSLS